MTQFIWKLEVRNVTKESYLSYIFLPQSENKNNKLKVYLQKYFTTVDEWYPKSIQGTLMLLDKYTKYSLSKNTASEGTSLYQRCWDSNKQLPPYNKEMGKYTILHMVTESSTSITFNKKSYQ